MLLIIRKIKRTFFANKQFHNYIGYALGEMVLVVIGILIALQIDNWNTEEKQEDALKSYLNSIARNIGTDLVAVSEIRAKRETAYELGLRWTFFSLATVPYDIAEIDLANRALNHARKLHQFNATASGYEALKNSGNLDRLQGRDIETLLYDYYDTVSRIAHTERNHNEYVSRLWLQVLAEWPNNMARWEWSDPALLTASRFQALQPAYRQVLSDTITSALYKRAHSVGPLIIDYDRLDRLGRAFIGMVENGTMQFDDATVNILEGIYDPDSGIGYPNLITEGQVSWQSYTVGGADSGDSRISELASGGEPGRAFNIRSFRITGDSLHLAYQGGAEWAGIWFFVGTDVTSRESRDYSMFDKLVLELKGDLGGERVLVNIEDRDDPRDGTSTRIELQLTDQWQTYEIDLAEFETADLSKLDSALGFVFLQKEPQSFSVRTVRFVDSKQTPTGASH